MSISQEQRTCRQWCWVLAGAIGIVSALLLMIMAGWGIVSGLFAGIVIGIIMGALLSWFMCSDLQAESGHHAETMAAAATGAPAPAASASAAADQTAAPGGAAAAQAPNEDRAAAAPAPVADSAAEANADTGATVKSGTGLAGEQELADRKGEWRYEKSDDAATDGGASGDAEPAVSDAVAADLAAGKDVDMTDYDGDGVSEGTGEGVRPAGLDGARGGQADDLKQIKGVGPKLEQLLQSLGFYHFDQIANWTADEVAWVDANLKGFKGRVSRDNWVEQSRILASGGETEFSKKVEKGGVY